MFLPSSRYHKQKTEDVTLSDGRRRKVLTLRQLPAVSGEPTVIKGHDRLDIMAQRQYDDPTMFWHIADANSELQANKLTGKIGRRIELPEQ